MRPSKIDPETRAKLQDLAERLERMRSEALGMLFQAVRTIIDLGEKRFGPVSATVFSSVHSINDVNRANRIIMRLLDATSWDDLLATP